MSNEIHELDRLIDEVLDDLTAGAPRDGFRGRVMASITASPEPSRVRFVDVLGWRVQPVRLAGAAALAVCVLVAALAIPSLLRRSAPPPAQTATAGSPSAVAPQTPATPPTAAPSAAVQMQAANTPARPEIRRVTVERRARATATPAADEAPGTVQWLTVDPLRDPDPVVHSAIEIRPVEIEPLVIPEIEVPALESSGTVRSPGPSK